MYAELGARSHISTIETVESRPRGLSPAPTCRASFRLDLRFPEPAADSIGVAADDCEDFG